jgi:hypothetical protein
MPNARHKPQPVILSRRVIFLHIAKTAGTSIVHFFRQRLPQQSICSHGDFLRFPADAADFAAQAKQYRFLSGHFGYSDIASELGDAYSFTFLRDPVARVLSLYKFCMHPDMQRQFAVARAARDLGLEGFLESTLPEVCEMLDNQQTWQLARNYWQSDREALHHLEDRELLALALEHLEEFSHVGLTETFNQDFSRILLDLNIDEPVPNVRQFRTQDPLDRSQLSATVREKLRQRLAMDYQLIDSVRRKLPARTAGMSPNGH